MRGTPRGTIHLVRPDTLITGFMLVRERIESSARSLPLQSHRSALRYALAILPHPRPYRFCI
jgi:hypothetical protein